jgi:hypothetical protein
MALAPKALIDLLTRHQHATQKEDVLVQITRMTNLTADQREDWYRRWCKRTVVSVLRSDVERVRAARVRDQQHSLFGGSHDRPE